MKLSVRNLASLFNKYYYNNYFHSKDYIKPEQWGLNNCIKARKYVINNYWTRTVQDKVIYGKSTI